MATAILRDAVLTVSENTGHSLDILRSLGALERDAFLSTLRPLNVARWAVLVHRLSSDPAYSGEFTDADVKQARNLSRSLLLEVAA